MNDESLDRLAGALQNGDAESFKSLVELLTRRLIAMAYRYTDDWESARDITQDTWLKVFENIDRYNRGKPFRNWLLVIHRNGCISHLRKRVRRIDAPLGEGPILRAADADPGPSELMERKQFGDRVRRAITKLSKKQQLVLTIVDIEQTDQEEAARSLGMKPVTLRTTLHHARRRLAVMLRKE
jgi:RNA polymerase sigma-70 factor (ECF subfamily)